MQENTRLQGKIVRLNLGTPRPEQASPEAMEELNELREENAELREDNDRMLSHLDELTEKKNRLEALLQGMQMQGKPAQDWGYPDT